MLDQVGALTNYAGTTLAGKEYRRRSELSDSVCDQRALTDGGRIHCLNNASWGFMWLSLLEISTLIIQSVVKSSNGDISISYLPRTESILTFFDYFCDLCIYQSRINSFQCYRCSILSGFGIFECCSWMIWIWRGPWSMSISAPTWYW